MNKLLTMMAVMAVLLSACAPYEGAAPQDDATLRQSSGDAGGSGHSGRGGR